MKKIITESAIRNIATQEVKNILNEVESSDEYPYEWIDDGTLIGYTDTEIVGELPTEGTKVRQHKPGTNQDGAVKQWNGERWLAFKSQADAKRDGDVIKSEKEGDWKAKPGFIWVDQDSNDNWAVKKRPTAEPEPAPEPEPGPQPPWDDAEVSSGTDKRGEYVTDGG